MANDKSRAALRRKQLTTVRKMLREGKGGNKIASAMGITPSAAYHLIHLSGVKRKDVSPQATRVQTIETYVPNPDDVVLRSYILSRLSKNWAVIGDIARACGLTSAQIKTALGHLKDHGYNLVYDGNRVRIAHNVITGGYKELHPITGKVKKFGVVSDTHLCSRAQRLDILEAAYDDFVKEGIKKVYHCGNIVDGESDLNRFDLLVHGVTDQALYCLDHYPQRSGITTYYITGSCHEGWWFNKTGLDFGRYLGYEAKARGRKDLVNLGFLEADVELKGPNGTSAMMRLFHPGGGSSYALSYQLQKIVESFQGGEKPAVLLCGHFHKLNYFIVRNVHCFSTGSMQDQTAWMRKKRIASHLGYWVIELRQDSAGAVREVKQRLIQYFDRKYHVRGDGF